MTWTAELVDHLCDLKRQGYGFERAWRIAVAAHPPPRRDMGLDAETLFEAARDEAETITEFLHRAASDAWFGRRPALAKLPVLLVGGEVFPSDEGRPAVGRSRRPAA